jgi:hypothetical protein
MRMAGFPRWQRGTGSGVRGRCSGASPTGRRFMPIRGRFDACEPALGPEKASEHRISRSGTKGTFYPFIPRR